MQQSTWGFPRLAHQDQLDELGRLEDELHLPKGEPAAAEPGWLPSCLGPIAALSGFPAASAADPAPAAMSSASGSSASSVCSDGRKRKESSPDLAAASKRYRHHDPLCLTSLSSVFTAASSSLTQIEEAAGLQWSTSNVSCVADATDQRNRFGASTPRCPPGKCKSPKTRHASYKVIEVASCDVIAGERLCRAAGCRTQDDTGPGSDSESDEDVTSSDPDHGQTMEKGREFASQTVASKKRKVDKYDVVEDEALLECCTRETPSSLEEEDADSCAQTVSTEDVKAATSSPDDESRSPPFFVLSSGRLSKGEEKRLGKRPPTVDDEFDRYFARLIL